MKPYLVFVIIFVTYFHLTSQNCLETISPIDSFSMGFPFQFPSDIIFNNGYILVKSDSFTTAFLTSIKTKKSINIEYGKIRGRKTIIIDPKNFKIEKNISYLNFAEFKDLIIDSEDAYFIVTESFGKSQIYHLNLKTHELKTLTTKCKNFNFYTFEKFGNIIYVMGTDEYKKKICKIPLKNLETDCPTFVMFPLFEKHKTFFCVPPFIRTLDRMINDSILIINHSGYSTNYAYSLNTETYVATFSNPNELRLSNTDFLFSPKSKACGNLEQNKKIIQSCLYSGINTFQFNERKYIYQYVLMPSYPPDNVQSLKELILQLKTNCAITIWNENLQIVSNLLLSKGTHFLGFHNDKFYSFDYLNDQEIKIYEYNTHQLLSSH